MRNSLRRPCQNGQTTCGLCCSNCVRCWPESRNQTWLGFLSSASGQRSTRFTKLVKSFGLVQIANLLFATWPFPTWQAGSIGSLSHSSCPLSQPLRPIRNSASTFQMNAWCWRAVVTSPFHAHEHASQEHKDGREDHHHRVDGNRMFG